MIIIADDLTGANDTAIQYHNSGISTIVGIRPRLDFSFERLSEYEVIAVNTESRSLSARSAYETTYRIAEYYNKKRPNDTIYKKIDSVLRGNPGIELDAVMDAVGCGLAFVAPAYPKNNRTVRDGILYAGGGSSPAVALFAEQMKHRVEGVPLSLVEGDADGLARYLAQRIHEKAEVFVFDSASDQNLKTIYEATKRVSGKRILCGSAGFARFAGEDIAIDLGHKEEKLPPVSKDIVLVVAGTRHSSTRSQMIYASRRYGEPLIIYDGAREPREDVFGKALEDAERQIGRGSPVLFIAVTGLFEDPAGTSPESPPKGGGQDALARVISENLGRLVKQLYRKHSVRGILLTGGDTASQVAQSLGVYGIEPLSEIAPGIPLGTFVGGEADQMLVVTKSGGFGSESAIADCVESIFGYTGKKEKRIL